MGDDAGLTVATGSIGEHNYSPKPLEVTGIADITPFVIPAKAGIQPGNGGGANGGHVSVSLKPTRNFFRTIRAAFHSMGR